MIRQSLILAALLACGCRDEPTIVITFAPQDGAVRPAPADLALPSDLAQPVDLATGLATPPVVGDACKKDSDCKLVNADCCGCTAGGKALAIAASRVKSHANELAAKCSDTMCPQMISHDPSCGSSAVCLSGRCALGAAKGDKKK